MLVEVLDAEQGERAETVEDIARHAEFARQAERPRVAHPGDDAARSSAQHRLAELFVGSEEAGHVSGRPEEVQPLAALGQAGLRRWERDRGDRDRPRRARR